MNISTPVDRTLESTESLSRFAFDRNRRSCGEASGCIQDELYSNFDFSSIRLISVQGFIEQLASCMMRCQVTRPFDLLGPCTLLECDILLVDSPKNSRLGLAWARLGSKPCSNADSSTRSRPIRRYPRRQYSMHVSAQPRAFFSSYIYKVIRNTDTGQTDQRALG